MWSVAKDVLMVTGVWFYLAIGVAWAWSVIMRRLRARDSAYASPAQ